MWAMVKPSQERGKFGTATRLTGRTRFELSGGSSLDIADMASADYADFVLNDISSTLNVRGNLYLNPNSSLKASVLSEVKVGGSFVYASTNEPSVDLTKAILHMTGSGLQWLEVGGTDNGLTGSSSGNFGIGRLEIGE